MKIKRLALSVVLLALLNTSVHAKGLIEQDASAMLHITAQITTGACTPVMENGGVDFGDIPVSHLNQKTPTILPAQKTLLTITCSSPVMAGFTIDDDRQDTLVPQLRTGESALARFGLGATAQGTSLGGYSIESDRAPLYDGHKGRLIVQNRGARVWLRALPAMLPGNDKIWTVSPGNSVLLPVSFIRAEFPLAIHAVLRPRETLHITDQTKLDGLTTFTLVYL